MRQVLLAATLVFALSACGSDEAAPPDASAGPDTAGAAPPSTGDAPGASGAAGPQAAAAQDAKRTPVFTRTFTHERQSYTVEVSSGLSHSSITITPKGLTLSNKPVTGQREGLLSGAEMADIDADGQPEIYVFLKSTATDDHASAFVVTTDQGRRLVEVPVPDLAADAKNSTGYRGSDEFAIVETVLARRFPLHDAGGEPTGTMRQMQYKLVKGATGPELKLDQVAEF